MEFLKGRNYGWRILKNNECLIQRNKWLFITSSKEMSIAGKPGQNIPLHR